MTTISTISTISVTISTALLALESPLADVDSMDHSDHAALGEPAVGAVQTALEAAYPDANIEISWSRDALTRHHVEVSTEDGPCGVGDLAVADVRDTMHEALYDHLAG